MLSLSSGVLALQQMLNTKSQDSARTQAASELPLAMKGHSQHLAGSVTTGAVVHVQGRRGLPNFPCMHIYCCRAPGNVI